MTEDGHNKDAVERKAKEIFIESIHETATLIAEQLYERYQYQRTALARQFPFMMGNDVWKGGAALNPNEQVGDVLRSGTLGTASWADTMPWWLSMERDTDTARRHGTPFMKPCWKSTMVADEYKAKYNLNYSVLAIIGRRTFGTFHPYGPP